jgi:hypothetical protein
MLAVCSELLGEERRSLLAAIAAEECLLRSKQQLTDRAVTSVLGGEAAAVSTSMVILADNVLDGGLEGGLEGGSCPGSTPKDENTSLIISAAESAASVMALEIGMSSGEIYEMSSKN